MILNRFCSPYAGVLESIVYIPNMRLQVVQCEKRCALNDICLLKTLSNGITIGSDLFFELYSPSSSSLE